MIKINICGLEQIFDSSITSWVQEKYHNRTKDGADFWFIITIESSSINLVLSSAGAPHGRGTPYSYFNHNEQRIIDMWNEMGAKQSDNISNLLRFLNHLKSIVA